MKKKYPLWAVTLALHTISNQLPAHAQSVIQNATQDKPAVQDGTKLLPPIRRIGIDLIQVNIDEFRNYMRQNDRLLQGVIALPFNENDLRKQLSNDLDKQILNSGRFWDLNIYSFYDLPVKKEIEDTKQQLEKDYQLDAWVKASFIFSPEQTLVRLVLVGPGNSGQNLAREDILLAPQATQNQIQSGIAQAITRLMSTLGHDGRVTSLKDNYMTVDFGSESGLIRGDKLEAGYVLLSSFHPQSGEFLRSKRVPIYKLNILEVHQGSSLCQITAVDSLKKEQFSKSLGDKSPVLLSWKTQDKSVADIENWQEPYDPQTAPILGAVESGFGVPMQTKNIPELPNLMSMPVMQQQKQINKLNQNRDQSQILIADSKAKTFDKKTDNKFLLDEYEVVLDPTNKKIFQRRARWASPSTWHFQQLTAGVGFTFGTFLDSGNTSSFPLTLINQIENYAFIYIDKAKDLYMKPIFKYSFLNGSKVTGYSYQIGNTLYVLAWRKSETSTYLYFGGGAQIDGGKLKDSPSIMNLSLNPSIFWKSNYSGFGNYAIEASFSLYDVLRNYPVWNLRTEIQPSSFLTSELQFDFGFKRFKNNWLEMSFGVVWNFADTEDK